MKKTIILCFLSLLALTLTGCKDKHRIVEPKEGPAHLVIEPTEWQVGSVSLQSGIVEKEFAMINDGSEDLVIKEVENLCSCTRTEFVDKPIVPGHGRTLKVFLDTSHLTPGEFLRTIVVHSNGGDIAIDLTGERVE